MSIPEWKFSPMKVSRSRSASPRSPSRTSPRTSTPSRTSPRTSPRTSTPFDFESNILYSYAEPQSPIAELSPSIMRKIRPYRPKPKKRTRLTYQLVPEPVVPRRQSPPIRRPSPRRPERAAISTKKRGLEASEQLEPTQKVEESQEKVSKALLRKLFLESMGIPPYQKDKLNEKMIEKTFQKDFEEFVERFLENLGDDQ